MDNQIIEQVQMLLNRVGEIGDFIYQAAYQKVIYNGVFNVFFGAILLSISWLLYKAAYNLAHKPRKDEDDNFALFSYVLGIIILSIWGMFTLYLGFGNLFAPHWETIELIISTAKGL